MHAIGSVSFWILLSSSEATTTPAVLLLVVVLVLLLMVLLPQGAVRPWVLGWQFAAGERIPQSASVFGGLDDREVFLTPTAQQRAAVYSERLRRGTSMHCRRCLAAPPVCWLFATIHLEPAAQRMTCR